MMVELQQYSIKVTGRTDSETFESTKGLIIIAQRIPKHSR
jgi:hypothetical protein